MLAVIRIAGDVDIKEEIREAFRRLRLGRKYSCILVNEKSKVEMGMLRKVENHVAFGEIEKQILTRLVEKRAKRIDKKPVKDSEKIVSELLAGKKLTELGLKGYFGLHPPRGGIRSSILHFPKGVRGNNRQAINKLIEKML